MASEPLVTVLLEVSKQLGSTHDELRDERLIEKLSPSRLEIEPQLQSEALALVDKFRGEWKPFIQATIEASRSYNSKDTQLKVTDMIECVKHLTKIASHNGLWASQLLANYCTDLARCSCQLNDKNSLELAAAVLRQAFRVTVNDYEGEEPKQGRTKKCYDVAVCLLRVYIKMRAHSLAEGILNAVKQYSGSIPSLKESPWKTQVQFLFYRGCFAFYDQKYGEASQSFDDACNAGPLTTSQLERIMLYSIPSKFIAHNKVPTDNFWSESPRLRDLYKPLLVSCYQGNYLLYTTHMQRQCEMLKKHRLYLACDTMLPKLKLNLLRRAWEITGRPKRLRISYFAAALAASNLPLQGVPLDRAAEFYISQFILRGEVKGYVHHELQLLMLSKSQPFPDLVSNEK